MTPDDASSSFFSAVTGTAPCSGTRDNSLAPCTVLQLPVPEASGHRSPRTSPRPNENPFTSVVNGGAGPSGQREALNIRLPIAANNSSNASDMISDLFRRLNSVRDGPRNPNDHPFEGSLQQQQQQQQQHQGAKNSRTMLEMLIGNQMPTNRRHAEIVEEWFEDRVAELIPDGLSSLGGERAAALVDGDKWERLMHTCGTGMATLIQQAGVHCYERGAIMAEVRGSPARLMLGLPWVEFLWCCDDALWEVNGSRGGWAETCPVDCAEGAMP